MSAVEQELMAVEVDSLEGGALAWALCAAEGWTPHIGSGRNGLEVSYYDDGHGSWSVVRLDEGEAVQAIKRRFIGIDRPSDGQKAPTWRAVADFKGKQKPFAPTWVVSASAKTLETAVFRCVVKSVFNETMKVPVALMQELVRTDGVKV